MTPTIITKNINGRKVYYIDFGKMSAKRIRRIIKTIKKQIEEKK